MTDMKDLPAIRTGTPAVRTLDRVLVRTAQEAVRQATDPTTAVIGAVIAVCGAMIALAGGVSLIGIAITCAVFAGLVVAVLLAWNLVAVWHEIATEAEREAAHRARAGREARGRAAGAFNDLMGDRVEEWHALHVPLKALIDDEAAVAEADDVSIRLCRLQKEFEAALKEAGRSDTADIRHEAAVAAKAMVEAAVARHADIVRRIRTADEARAPDVARRFAETARAVAGMPSAPGALPPPSASAALQRLIGLAEDALAVDPDLTDGAGARVDALVRDHLPRLLATHASAARAPGADLAKVDAELGKGVEEVRASVEEALAADARLRFDRLREEVSFLKTRRQG